MAQIPESEKKILEEINYYKDKYFTYDEPIPFHGLTIYPVTMRNYQQFMVSTACLTLNKNDDIRESVIILWLYSMVTVLVADFVIVSPSGVV